MKLKIVILSRMTLMIMKFNELNNMLKILLMEATIR